MSTDGSPVTVVEGYAEVVPELRSIMPTDLYTYAVPPHLARRLRIGERVEIPFGSRAVLGYVMGGAGHPARADRVRPITAVIDEPPILLSHHVALARWIAARYCAPLGEVLKAMIPKGVRSARPGGRSRGPRGTSRGVEAARSAGTASVAPALSDSQRAAAALLIDAIDGRRHRRVLLHGVTGSGKTEVYLAALHAALERGRQAIVLVPEIALTPQMIRRFAGRFPGRVAVIHSALTEAERATEWRRLRQGEATVVVGSRSAIFAPLDNLGVIVVDEEDSSAYKQDRVPRYHAVDVAMELGRQCAAPVVVGSATPRVETFFAAHTGGMELASLPERITGRRLPTIEVVDLRDELRAGNRSAMSPVLVEALAECHGEGGQSILFLNRRGTATVVLCRACGEAMTCRHCSVSMVYHHGRGRCDCHYCGDSRPLPRVCVSCGSTAISGLGTGTERLEAEVHERFPQLRLLRMDRDTTATRDAYFTIYERFRAHEADCLIGTQMVAKGWDLDQVRLVGIVNADTSLHFPDYRSGEVTFSLITQVAGRAGRGDAPARVILQTHSPGHYAVRHATAHDYLGFAREEIRFRRQLQFPPYTRLVVCTYTDADDGRARRAAEQAAGRLSGALEGGDDPIAVLGPSPAFLHRLRGQYRWQVTLRGREVERAFPMLPTARGWSVDVDPAM
ncbi:MAG: primosomal protein N' [Candidatus Dormibacteria bacterium]